MPESNKPVKVHYIHNLSSIVQARIVGIFVVSAVIVIVGLILIQVQSSHLLDDRVHYDAYLTNAQGVTTETLINISGIEVGQVMSISITDDNRIHVKFFVYDSFQRLLRSDSTGELNKLSVIGNAAIIIKAGSHQLPILPANSTIPIEEPVTVDELMAELTPVITSVKEIVLKVSAMLAVIEPEQLQTITQNLSGLVANLHKVSGQVAEGKGPVGKILFDQGLEKNITSSVQNIEPIVKDVGTIVKDAEKAMLMLQGILHETDLRVKEVSQLIKPATKLTVKSNKIATDLKSTTELVNKEVQQLPEMIRKMQALLDSTNRTINATQKIWPISTTIAPVSNDTIIKEQPLDD